VISTNASLTVILCLQFNVYKIKLDLKLHLQRYLWQGGITGYSKYVVSDTWRTCLIDDVPWRASYTSGSWRNVRCCSRGRW